MMFSAHAPAPRHHLTAAAKTIAINAIKHGHLPRSPEAASSFKNNRPLTNRFGRKFLKVAADIPLPDKGILKTARPFAHMECGESFFEPVGDLSKETLIRRIKMDAKDYSPRKFICEARTEGGIAGVRVWRNI
jgi:hypothetical protein